MGEEQRARGREREREGERERIASRLCAASRQSLMPGSNARSRESRTWREAEIKSWTLDRLSHPGAPPIRLSPVLKITRDFSVAKS